MKEAKKEGREANLNYDKLYIDGQRYKADIFPDCKTDHSLCNIDITYCRASDRNKLERINERGLRTVFLD